MQTAAGNVEDFASIFKANGDQVKTGGAPPLLFSRPPERFDPLEYVEGEPPASPQEVAINKGTADDEGLKIGDRVSLVGRTGRRDFRISGLATFGDVESLGGATVSVVTLPVAQDLADQRGKVDSIQVAAASGVTPQELVTRIERAMPDTVEVKTGQQEADGRVGLDQEQPQLPEHPAARVRRHRGVRRRVHHLQHVLDHGCAAHQGVRAAPHHGRLAPPGAALGDAGGADRGADRLHPRTAARHRHRTGHQRVVQGLRGGSSAGGARAQATHDHRGAAGRDRCDDARQPRPCPARDACAAAGRDAGGGRDPAAPHPAPHDPVVGSAHRRSGCRAARALRRAARPVRRSACWGSGRSSSSSQWRC